jgi:hypothetical protein
MRSLHFEACLGKKPVPPSSFFAPSDEPNPCAPPGRVTLLEISSKIMESCEPGMRAGADDAGVVVNAFNGVLLSYYFGCVPFLPQPLCGGLILSHAPYNRRAILIAGGFCG